MDCSLSFALSTDKVSKAESCESELVIPDAPPRERTPEEPSFGASVMPVSQEWLMDDDFCPDDKDRESLVCWGTGGGVSSGIGIRRRSGAFFSLVGS